MATDSDRGQPALSAVRMRNMKKHFRKVISELRILRKAKKAICASRKAKHIHIGTSAYGIRVLLLSLDRSSVACEEKLGLAGGEACSFPR
jgi:hypothetical protein